MPYKRGRSHQSDKGCVSVIIKKGYDYYHTKISRYLNYVGLVKRLTGEKAALRVDNVE